MAVQMIWQQNVHGAGELWLVEDGAPSCRLLAVDPDRMTAVRPLVQRWADQADSVPEFLEMMHLEDLIDLETLQRLLTDQVPLYRIWDRLREFCREAGDISVFPAPWITIGTGAEEWPEGVLNLPEGQVLEALAAWHRFEAGEPQALSDANLAVVVAALGELAGRRLGLSWPATVHFGDWLTGVITGALISHANEDQLWRLETMAARAAAGGPQHIGPACYNPAVWEVYRPAVAVVMRALREEV